MKNPHRNSAYVPTDGRELPMIIFESNAFSISAVDVAKEIVHGKSKAQIVVYISEILIGIETVKLEALRRQCPYGKCNNCK